MVYELAISIGWNLLEAIVLDSCQDLPAHWSHSPKPFLQWKGMPELLPRTQFLNIPPDVLDPEFCLDRGKYIKSL